MAWIVLVLGHLSPKDEIFSKIYVPPPLKKRKEESKVVQVLPGIFKNLPSKLPTKSGSRVRLQITNNGIKKAKELNQKQNKDELKVVLLIEQRNRVQNSPARANPMTGLSSKPIQQTKNDFSSSDYD